VPRSTGISLPHLARRSNMSLRDMNARDQKLVGSLSNLMAWAVRCDYGENDDAADGPRYYRSYPLRCPRMQPLHLVLKPGLASPAGLEPATLCLEGRCSVHLSYGLCLDFIKCIWNWPNFRNRSWNVRYVFDSNLTLLLDSKLIRLTAAVSRLCLRSGDTAAAALRGS
jgi:hypothetical protein